MRILVVSGSKAQLPDPVYPLGAAIVATACERAGHQVEWFDALRQQQHLTALTEKIAACSPEVVLLSIRNIDSGAFPRPDLYFEDHRPVVETCRAATGAPIVVGGSGFSLMPKAFMRHLGADCGVVGDGAAAIKDILARLEAGQPCAGVLEAGDNVDPFYVCDRRFFDAPWYYEKGGVANIQTKLGCAQKCIYCTYPCLEGKGTRRASPRAVVDEAEAMVASGIRHFFFVDAVFNSPESHAAQICEEILRRDLDISFTGYFVPKGDLPEFPGLIKRAGCTAVEFGTDALADSILASLQKGFTVDEAVRYTERFAAEGIDHCHNLIFGGPGETARTMATSVARMDSLRPTAVIATIGLRVYPGTDLARMARARENTESLSDESLSPVFYVEEAVADTIIAQVDRWVEDRKGWVCPGLGKRYNARYLARRRMHLNHKGVLWPLL
jgi:radical SAM superfamily enzyme YgiQ (UPF0313 family)